MTSIRKILLNSQDSALITLLLILGGLIGARDLVRLVLPGDLGLLFIMALFLVIFVRTLMYERHINHVAPMPMVMGKFNPFGLSAASTNDAIWPRDEEAKTLAERIIKSKNSHLLVSGPSGAGKSTLVEKIVIPNLSSVYQPHVFREYNDIVLKIIELEDGDAGVLSRQRSLSSKYISFIEGNQCRPSDVLDTGFWDQHSDAKMLWAEMEQYLIDTHMAKPPRCYIFDQIERYLNVMLSNEENIANINGYELYFFINFMRFCRNNNEIRTVLIIRSENFYESVNFLELVVAGNIGQFSYFLCPGINTATAPKGVKAIRKDFAALGLGATATGHFDQICKLDSRSHSNTFLTQMVGYVVEHFHESDSGVQNFLSQEMDRNAAIRSYFVHFLNDFVRETSTVDGLETLKSVLFAIAVENETTGQGVSLPRIVALTHMPEESVERAIQYALKTGVLTADVLNGDRSYRLIHDLISDYVLGNEQFSVHPVLKDSIRGLSENRVGTTKMIQVDRYADVLRDIWEAPNIGVYMLWLFFIFGILKNRWEPICTTSSVVLGRLFDVSSCASVSSYYLPVYISHVVWLIFIYHMDRDYLRFVLKTRALRWVSAAMPVVGALLAIAMSQSPHLIVIPVVTVGALMGVLLLLGVLDGSFVGSEASLRGRWGLRTISNMLFTSCLSLLTWLFFWTEPAAMQFWDRLAERIGDHTGIGGISRVSIAYGWIYAVSLVLIYFWVHIRPEQQSRVSSAARLAAFDRAKSDSYEQNYTA